MSVLFQPCKVQLSCNWPATFVVVLFYFILRHQAGPEFLEIHLPLRHASPHPAWPIISTYMQMNGLSRNYTYSNDRMSSGQNLGEWWYWRDRSQQTQQRHISQREKARAELQRIRKGQSFKGNRVLKPAQHCREEPCGSWQESVTCGHQKVTPSSANIRRTTGGWRAGRVYGMKVQWARQSGKPQIVNRIGDLQVQKLIVIMGLGIAL